MLLDKPLILRIRSNLTILYHALELIKPIHLNAGINGVPGLIDHIPLTTFLVVLHAGRSVNADPLGVLDEVIPIVFHWPAPFVAVGIRFDIAEVVEQHTGKGFTDRQRDHAELNRTIIAHLNLDTVPMLALLATFGSLIVDTDEYLALRASDLDACTLGADDALPIVGLADVHSALCIP